MSKTLAKHSAPALLLLAAVACLPAQAAPGGHGGPGGPFGGLDRELFMQEHMAAELGLDDAQRAAVEKVIAASREQARPYVKQIIEQRRDMEALHDAETFDENAVRAHVAKNQAAMTELAVIHARTAFEVRKILTPAQREKMKAMHGRHRRQDG